MTTTESTEQAKRALADPPAKNPIEQVKMQIVERRYADVWKTGTPVQTYEKTSNWEWF